jgi:uncharacterized iron-regulated membrane protein
MSDSFATPPASGYRLAPARAGSAPQGRHGPAGARVKPLGAGSSRVRRVALVAHRYVGLLLSMFLLVAGLTGALLAFYADLDGALNPSLVLAEPEVPGAPFLEPFALQARFSAQLPAGARAINLQFQPQPHRAIRSWVEVAPETWREFFVNPYTGAVQGSRQWGALSEGPRNLMPFLYRLHFSLALGQVGTWLFGVAALLWTVDCFVGAYLTFPAPERRAPGSPLGWLRRWLPAWRVKTGKLFAFAFTWHRASGLWVWALLLVFAWSAVGLNLHGVYQPIMKALAGLEPDVHEQLPHLAAPYPEPRLTLRQAHARGRELMAEQASRRGFQVGAERWLTYHADHGVFSYGVASSLDISSEHPHTEVYFDGQDGRLVGFQAPTGGRAGNTVTSYINHLHFAALGGYWYRALVSVLGLLVSGLSVTGAWIWWRKRQKRTLRTGAQLGSRLGRASG